MPRSKNGGAAIGSGGFGCVFKPALKCKNSNKRTIGISKLLITKEAEQEYKLLQNIEDVVKTIKDNRRYFLLYEISMCKPDKLTETDLQKFDEKCKLFKREDDNSKKLNINKDLNKLSIINMPYGGVDLSYILEIIKLDSPNGLQKLNTHMVKLLKNGIIPLNKKDVYHTDIKPENILVLEQDGLPRLIDWGGALIDNGKLNEYDGRPMQFNQPLSLLAVHPMFIVEYNKFLREKKIKNLSSQKDSEMVRLGFVPQTYAKFIKTDMGHHEFMIDMYNRILFDDKLDKDEATVQFILLMGDYIMPILEMYTKNGKFNVKDYFFNIFLKISDIWGFICCYDKLHSVLVNSDMDSENKKFLMDKIKELFKELLSSPTKLLDVDNLVNIIESMHIDRVNNRYSNKTMKNNKFKNKTRKRNSN